MSDFLSNLIGRSFTDAPVIQPRVPSLFETTGDEFFDEQQSSTPSVPAAETIAPKDAPAPVSKLSPARETAATESMAKVSDSPAEGRPLKPDAPADEEPPMTAQSPLRSVQAAEVRKLEIAKKKSVSKVFSEPRSVQPRHQKDLSPVEQRSSSAAPIIRVTIGRVEVRAIHPPSPAPKPMTPAPPRLSLEDYLRKRERGSR